MLLWLLQNTVLAGLLASAVALLCRWKRVGPALRHALWVLVLLRLVWPPGVVTWPWHLPALPVSQPAVAAPAEPRDIATASTASTPADGVLEGVEIVRVENAEEPTAAAAPAEVGPAAMSAPLPWWTVAWWAGVSVWAAGAVVVAARHLHGLMKLLRVVRRAEPATAGAIRHVDETAARLGIRPPRVRVVAGLGSPLVAGLVRPVLLWPKELQGRLGEDGFKAVLIHELAHLRRRDHWVRWVEMAAGCVWWWNPLYRLARRRVRQYAELACDAWVLAILPRARRAYAEALLHVCETVSKAAEPAPVLGVGGDPADIQRRLTMIMRETVSCRVGRRALLALGLLALLAVPGWSLGEPPAPKIDVAVEPDTNDDIALDIVLKGVLDIDVDAIKRQPDRDQKLADIEAQIKALLKEIEALKAERAAQKSDNYRSTASRALADAARARMDEKQRRDLGDTQKRLADRFTEEFQKKARSATEKKEGEIVLHRVSYAMPQGKAEALAKFLKEFVKGGLHDCTVAGDKLIVTTTPENQNVIGRLIKLIQEAPSSASPKK
jgi:beta-lactamase regulating signal transducer with metallopeptidase domain